MPNQTEYAKAGVDYTKIDPFKQMMLATAARTTMFPWRRNISVLPSGAYDYRGNKPFLVGKPILEGLGNKNWVAEWMYRNANTGETYYRGIGYDTAMMAVNDFIAQGAMPVTYNDEVAAGSSEWFEDEKRARDLAKGFCDACRHAGMALVGGESPSLRYLVNARLPVESAPVLSGCVTGIIAPASRLIDGNKLQAGDSIVGIASSGVHCNGFSLIIKRMMRKKNKFLEKLPHNGRTIGEEVLTKTLCYVSLVEGLLDAGVDVHAFLPGTGDGVAKLAADKRPFTYRIHFWPEVPPIFQYFRELGISIGDCLKTFNWGIGYYVFVSPSEVERTIRVAGMRGYGAWEVGQVEEGNRCTIFGPEKDIVLEPPGA